MYKTQNHMKIHRAIARDVHSMEGTGVLMHISKTWARFPSTKPSPVT